MEHDVGYKLYMTCVIAHLVSRALTDFACVSMRRPNKYKLFVIAHVVSRALTAFACVSMRRTQMYIAS